MLVAISWGEGCQIHQLFSDPSASVQGVFGKAIFQKCSHIHNTKHLESASAPLDFYMIIFGAFFVVTKSNIYLRRNLTNSLS